ncbi:STAS domain-containing protein [Streptomyces sp. NPDC058662]|uniref:STAS domain-containing protein n=1 Tax=Streptomyces sp. NPDC058662 TaxID=3346583 RepID=UPI003662AEEF
MYEQRRHRGGGASASVRWDAERACLVLAGEFDIDSVPVAGEALSAVPATVREVVVDVRAVGFADCALLGLLVAARGTRSLTLGGPLPVALERLLAATGTRGLFPVVRAAAPAEYAAVHPPLPLRGQRVPAASYVPPAR